MDGARRLRLGPLTLVLAASALPAGLVASDGRLFVWRLEGDRVVADPGAPALALPVGSLQKPFVAKAWARAHPGRVPEAFRCDVRSGCWLRSGHGLLDLGHATAVSCNAYFRHLAEETPADVLVATLRAEGFLAPEGLSPSGSIGLESDRVAIAPADLLEAYRRLTREPWPAGEQVRRLLLAGLRDAALSGTASGLSRRGYWAKTGTSASIEGRPLATSGWAVAVDDAGWGVLALLPSGTGREAARRLAQPLAALRPWASPDERSARDAAVTAPATREARRAIESVRVALFEALAPERVSARNCGPQPVAGSHGYVGAGATVTLEAGTYLGAGVWELAVPDRRATRRVSASLSCERAVGGPLHVVAEMEPREYVNGVVAAELPDGRGPLREELATAVLRFLSAGPRHEGFDVCDTTHCAWFLGRGPRLVWAGGTASPVARRAAPESRPLDDAAWSRVVGASAESGPAHWTGHCGGAPLSPHAVWGNGDRRVLSCPRHAGGTSRPWARFWSDAEVAAAFGADATDLSIEWPDGVWTLETRSDGSVRRWRYDEAHRALAAPLGWGALPSPATRVARAAGGWRAEGVGLGHRVGLCLADDGRSAAIR